MISAPTPESCSRKKASSMPRLPPGWPTISRHQRVANIHSCSLSPAWPNGASRLWGSPVPKPSSEMENCWTRASDIGWLLRQIWGWATHTNRPDDAGEIIGRRKGGAADAGSGRLGAEDDAAVGGEAETRVVRDLPSMPVEVAEDAGVPAVERLGGLSGDGSAGLAGVLDHAVDLFGRRDVVRERDAAPARAVVGDTGVCRQLLPRPEDEHDAVRLEEGGLLDLEHGLPPERRVERVRLLVVAHPECDQGHALPHSASSLRSDGGALGSALDAVMQVRDTVLALEDAGGLQLDLLGSEALEQQAALAEEDGDDVELELVQHAGG